MLRCMSAVRTQIYLTQRQRQGIDQLARRSGRSLADIVRDALDDYLEHQVPDAGTALDATFGSLPDLEVPSRREWDRG
jgi:predicted DNA-binding protein